MSDTRETYQDTVLLTISIVYHTRKELSSMDIKAAIVSIIIALLLIALGYAITVFIIWLNTVGMLWIFLIAIVFLFLCIIIYMIIVD
jgi:hypothetical protein